MRFDLEKFFEMYFAPSLVLLVPLLFFGLLFIPTSKPKSLALDLYSLKCKTVTWEQKSDKTICLEFDLAYAGTKKIQDIDRSKYNDFLEYINNHCLSNDKKNCKSIVVNFNAIETEKILKGTKKVETDFLGNLSSL